VPIAASAGNCGGKSSIFATWLTIFWVIGLADALAVGLGNAGVAVLAVGAGWVACAVNVAILRSIWFVFAFLRNSSVGFAKDGRVAPDGTVEDTLAFAIFCAGLAGLHACAETQFCGPVSRDRTVLSDDCLALQRGGTGCL